MATCDRNRYREWQRHAQEGCRDCAERLRAYNRDKQRQSRERRGLGHGGMYAYDTDTRRTAVRLAKKLGVPRAAAQMHVAESTLYGWCRAAGVTPRKG